MEHRARNQRLEIRRQRSGVKLISDLRLLASVIDDFYDFYDLKELNDVSGRTFLKYNRRGSRLQL